MNRRHFLKTLGLAGVAATAPPSPVHAAKPPKSGAKPRSIIMLVADGMSMGAWTCADIFSRQVRGEPLIWTRLAASPSTQMSLMDMSSLNSIVTDSAAASSAWGSGCRVDNGSLNALPDGKLLRPLLAVLKDEGWKTGVVTTTTVTHATPAGFLVANPSRNAEPQIAEQYLSTGVDVILGGGQTFFGEGLQNAFKAKGYTLCKTAEELTLAVRQSKLLGLFDAGHLPYVIDRKDLGLAEKLPTLAAMTKSALRHLSDGKERFFLQIEGGRVDHAAHANDTGAILHEMLDFDAAVREALEFQKQFPETLVVVTSDHGNANMGVNGMGGAYSGSDETFAHVAGFRASTGRLLQEMGIGLMSPDNPLKGFFPPAQIAPEKALAVVEKHTGITLTNDQARAFCALIKPSEEWPKFLQTTLNGQFANPANVLAQLLANHTGVGWTGCTHTSDFVPLTATGPGQEQFAGFLKNTDLFPRFMQFAGLKFSNA
ncbi:alkaline phosphatase [Oscillatoria amoena NRMC-F 0135]|nr:alkaline phosphatase [Oscillatoria amoena NRMC-F 0135]